MGRADLGRRVSCDECGGKYYTMNRPNPTCPKCGTAAPTEEDALLRSKRRRRAEAKAVKDLEAAVIEIDEDEEEEEEEVQEIIIDADDATVLAKVAAQDTDDEDVGDDLNLMDEDDMPDLEIEIGDKEDDEIG